MWRCARIRRWYLVTLKGNRQSTWSILQQVKWHTRNTEPCRSRPAAQFLPPPVARWDYFSLTKCQGHDSLRCPAGNSPLLPSKQMKLLRGQHRGYLLKMVSQEHCIFSNSYNKHQTCKHIYKTSVLEMRIKVSSGGELYRSLSGTQGQIHGWGWRFTLSFYCLFFIFFLCPALQCFWLTLDISRFSTGSLKCQFSVKDICVKEKREEASSSVMIVGNVLYQLLALSCVF